ncbi:MAG: hypothetical protein ACT4OJ_04325 [Bacteroidota bacterium]
MGSIETGTNEKPAGVVLPERPYKKKRVKVLRPSQIINKKRQFIDIGGEIGASIGKVEKGTKIFITGPSYSGKSSFVAKLCRAFADHLMVDYNNHEEKGGDAGTVKNKMAHAGIDESFDKRIRFYKAPLESAVEETWDEILGKKKSAGFAVLDSVQHSEMRRDMYLHLTDKYCNPRRGKILAFICHWVKNDFMKFIKHDCDVKIEVMNYVVYVESRLEGATNKPIVIWEEGAKKAWKRNYHSVIKGNYWPGKKK